MCRMDKFRNKHRRRRREISLLLLSFFLSILSFFLSFPFSSSLSFFFVHFRLGLRLARRKQNSCHESLLLLSFFVCLSILSYHVHHHLLLLLPSFLPSFVLLVGLTGRRASRGAGHGTPRRAGPSGLTAAAALPAASTHGRTRDAALSLGSRSRSCSLGHRRARAGGGEEWGCEVGRAAASCFGRHLM